MPRPLTQEEKRVIEFLIEHADSQIREALKRQLDGVQVIDEYPGQDQSIVLSGSDVITADAHRSLIEAQGQEDDAATVHVLLHLVNDKLRELEVFRRDGKPVEHLPKPEELTVIT